MIQTIARILTANGSNRAKPIMLKELENGCIVATSHALHHSGYLRLERNNKWVSAHRIVYEHFYGPIPKEIKVCHHCDNPPCLNPYHFFSGTQADNMRDRDMKGRHGAIGNTWNRR